MTGAESNWSPGAYVHSEGLYQAASRTSPRILMGSRPLNRPQSGRLTNESSYFVGSALLDDTLLRLSLRPRRGRLDRKHVIERRHRATEPFKLTTSQGWTTVRTCEALNQTGVPG